MDEQSVALSRRVKTSSSGNPTRIVIPLVYTEVAAATERALTREGNEAAFRPASDVSSIPFASSVSPRANPTLLTPSDRPPPATTYDFFNRKYGELDSCQTHENKQRKFF
jgi:hypothetical protein